MYFVSLLSSKRVPECQADAAHGVQYFSAFEGVLGNLVWAVVGFVWFDNILFDEEYDLVR
jgi:hypothetical protein